MNAGVGASASAKSTLPLHSVGSRVGDCGLAAQAGRENEFRDSVRQSLAYAQALSVNTLHCLSGRTQADVTWDNQLEVYVENLRWAASVCDACGGGVRITIEPINSTTLTDYVMSSYTLADTVLLRVHCANVGLQFDSFHAQMTCGRLTSLLRAHAQRLFHCQLSQVPGRHEPDDKGEINIPYVVQVLQEIGYSAFVGLEFVPRESTAAALSKPWMSLFARN